MKGFGSNNDWPYYAVPPSNLSAFATPFSVNRFPPNEVPDSVKPNFPYRFPGTIGESNSDFDSDLSNQFRFSGLNVLDSSCSQLPNLGQWSNSTNPSIVKSQQYFNSFGLHDHNQNSSSVVPGHWNSYSGFTVSDGLNCADYGNKSYELGFPGQSVGNQFTGFSNGKGKEIGGGSSLYSNQTKFSGSVVDERMNLGCQDITDNHGREVPDMNGWEKHSLPTSADHSDDKSFWWRTTIPMPVDFSHTSILPSPALSVETHHEAPLKLAVDSGNHYFSNTGLYDKHLGQQDKLSRVEKVSSAPITGSVTDFEHNHFYDLTEAHPTPSPGTAGCFGLGHLHMHLERNDSSSSNNVMMSDVNVSGDVVDYIHKARHEFQNPHPNLGHLNLTLNAIQGVNSVDKLLECGDPCNPSVDSPCWKGAPTAHFSYYESSEALPPEHLPKNEEYFGSVIQKPQSFQLDTESNVKKSGDGGFQMHFRVVDQETSSAGSPRKFAETRFASEDCKSDGAVNAGPFQSEPCPDYGLQCQDDITKIKESCVSPTKHIDCESGSSHDGHHVIEENDLVSQLLHTLFIDGADAGCNESSSVEDASTTPEKSAGKASTEKLNVQILVDMVQNLSQLLLNHCSDDACKLKERDCNILRNVISNLNTCVMKNAEQITPAQECLFPQPENSTYAGESCELQQGPQSTKIGPDSSMDEHENLLAQTEDLCFGSGKLHLKPSDSISPSGGSEMTMAKMTIDEHENLLVQKADLCFGSGKPHWKLSDSISPSGGAKMTKAENMTKAIKNILSENLDDDNDDGATESQTLLYKNLWLEAEAALCSVSFKARYNQMKIEMEKHSYKQRDMEEQSKSEVIPSLSRSQSSAIEVNKCPNTDSSAQDLAVIDVTNPKELSQLKFSSEMNRPDSLTPEAEGSENLYSFIRNYAVSGTNKETAGNDEASVMARYNVIKARADMSCTNTNELETPSDIADKLAASEIDNQNQVNFCQDFAILGKNKAGYDTSVLARFHILKSRAAEDSKSVSSTEKLFEISGKGIEDTITTEDAVDKSIPREIHLDLEDSQESEHHKTCEFQLPMYHSDGLASDWEHV